MSAKAARGRPSPRPAARPQAAPIHDDASPGEVLVRRHAVLLLAAAISAFAFAYGLTCAIKLRYYLYDDFDLAIFVQAVEGVLRGSTWSSIRGMTWVGDHASFILFPIAPLYALWRDPLMLLLIQTVALGLGAIPVFTLARRELGSASAALGLAVVYLLQPALGYVALFEFHPEALATPLLLAAFAATRAGSWRWAFAWSVLALLAREDVALAVAGLGVWALLRRTPGSRGFGIACLAIAAASLALFFGVVKPALAGGEEAYVGMYRSFGASVGEIVGRVATQPWRAAAAMFSTAGDPHDTTLKLQLWVHLLLPLGFLPLAAPLAFAIALPILGEHLLSFRTQQHTMVFQYSALVTPFAVGATVLGARRVAGWIARAHAARPFGLAPAPQVALVALLFAAGSAVAFGPFGAHVLQRFPAPQRVAPDGLDHALRAARDSMIARLPAGTVVAGFRLLPRLARRDSVHSLHHLLLGTYTFSNKPYPVPAGIAAVVADLADRRTVMLVDPAAGARLASLIAGAGLAPAAVQGDLVLWTRAPRETVMLVEPAPALAAAPAAVVFDSQLALLGVQHDSVGRPGGSLPIRTAWRRVAPSDRLHLTEWHLVDAQGRTPFQHVRHLGYIGWGPATWPTGEPRIEHYALTLPADLPPGDYTLALRMGWDSGDRIGYSELQPENAAGEARLIPIGRVTIRR